MLLQRNILAGLVVASLLAVVAFPLYAAFYRYPSFSRLVLESSQKEAERTAAHLAGQFFGASGSIRPEEVTPAFRGAVAGELKKYRLVT